MRFFLSLLCLAFLVSLATEAGATISKKTEIVNNETITHWWPDLYVPDAWHQDLDANIANNLNALVLDGTSFDTAETVIYANAVAKSSEPEVSTLDDFIEADKTSSAETSPGVSIEETTPLKIANGEALRSFLFTPTKDGNWERVTYAEEGDYYLTFCVSARTSEGLNAAMKAYEATVASYQKVPALDPPAPAENSDED